ncbi:MAG: response regulator [Xanthomonadales bacterium]|nr:response regulator [Gammaproteobacteria bacterium]MBT8052436.1 response regulator [Gammaproteobacteria bacterium]NND55953.1 response regulator [Xanthomonadales bacterium]NNK50538.1 response regulator [Xanthomonadales bacterium]
MTETLEQLRRKLARERTARLEAERLLEEKSDELYESLMHVQSSETLLRSALSSMYDGLLLTNQYHEVILANDQMCEIYSGQASLFKKGTKLEGAFDELLGHPDYRAMLEQSQTKASFRIQLADQRTVSVGVRFTREGFIASTHRDITQLLENEEERRRLLADLMRAQRMETIGRMSGTIAHDFNNIIASIKGYAGFLEEDLADDADMLDSAQRILAAAEKAERLIQQILEIGNQQQAPRHRVSLIPVIEESLDMFVHTLPDGADVEFDPPDEPIWVEANETRLGQLFMNLLTNARRAMIGRTGRLGIFFDCFDRLDLTSTPNETPSFPQGQISGAHSGQIVFDTPCVRVTLVDQGCGIEPELIERIFEMYVTTREDGSHGGVGMSSVADIAADYGGGVRITSALGSGTAVEIALPLAKEQRLRAPEQRSSNPQDGGSADVLLVDDDENVGEMLRQTLERAGITAEYHSKPQAALDLLLEDHRRWKVVVSDQIMPKLRGSDIFARLREAGIDIPFILCSAQIDPGSGEIQDWLQDDFIGKPVDGEELLDKVRRYL